MGNDGDLAAGIGYIERGMFEEAAAALSRAIAESPDAPEAPDVAKAFDLLGYATWCMGREEEALAAFRQSLQHAADAREQFRARVGAGQALLDLPVEGDDHAHVQRTSAGDLWRQLAKRGRKRAGHVSQAANLDQGSGFRGEEQDFHRFRRHGFFSFRPTFL